MSQFQGASNTTYTNEGAEYVSDANGILTVPDELDLIFRNIHGLASWSPAPVESVAPDAPAAKASKTSKAVAPAPVESEAAPKAEA